MQLGSSYPPARPVRRRPPVAPTRRAPERRGPVAREIARLGAHFREVLAELRARDVAHLSDPQRASRARLIAELERYARTGRFPRNIDFLGARVPYFIDAFGTRCAMAHLIESTGAGDLVARVAFAKNNAFLPELSAEPELVAWLDEAGLTLAEAARIQPAYCFVTQADACVCQGSEVAAVLEGTVTRKVTETAVVIRVDAVHGDPSAAAEGQEIELTPFAYDGGTVPRNIGDKLLFGVRDLPVETPLGDTAARRILEDGTVEPWCSIDVPKLAKADFIAAHLASDGDLSDAASGCSTYLAEQVNAVWGASQCDAPGHEGGGGPGSEASTGGGSGADAPSGDGPGSCSLASGGAGYPMMLGSLVLAAVSWRRRRARSASRARRPTGKPPSPGGLNASSTRVANKNP